VASAHDVAMHLRGAYLAMHRRANGEFAKFGVTADQFVMLAALAEAGAVTQQDLVRRCHSDPNTVRAILIRLEKSGLVARGPHATDLRAVSVALTERGKALEGELRAFNEAFQADLVGLFQPDELESLLGALARINRAMTASRHSRRKGDRSLS
jgi:DNA-binding MarR family transcriptional regulator